jgi:hypothetical protein
MKRVLCLSTAFIIASSAGLFAADYSQSIVSVEFFGGLGFPWGKIMDKEHSMYSVTASWADGHTQTAKPDHIAYHFGVYADLTPFRTSLESGSRLLFGLRSIYTYNAVYQSINLGGGSYESKSYGGTYLEFNTLTFGPVVSYIFGNTTTDGFSTSFSVDMFLVGGPIMSGTMTPAAAAADQSSANKQPSHDLSGIRITCGIAAVAHWERYDFGINMCYSRNMINTKEQVYTTIGKSTSFDEITWDLIFGFHY